ncbi:MAG: hypothetical protein U0Q18_34390 [Bryobacteraceae bacterium]
MHQRRSLGSIVTFYSYKGGTGRTMALTNIAYLLAQNHRVLIVDWDLEAPGLHRYCRELVSAQFPEDRQGKAFDSWPGLIDLLTAVARMVEHEPSNREEAARVILERADLDHYILSTDLPSLSMLKAGRYDAGYAAAVNTFGWEALHSRSPWLFRTLAGCLAERFDYVLVDSRTGITDTSGICTAILPDVLVLVFTPNRQSLLGCLDVAAQAARFRQDSDDLRPLRILPLPSRIDAAEPVLRDEWRLGKPEQDIPGYQPAFEAFFKEIYDLPSCDLAEYFSEVQVQHVPRFAYGEEIAALVESGDRLSLTRSFECFLKRLEGKQTPWSQTAEEAAPEPAPPVRDDAWIQPKRDAAEKVLLNLGGTGRMEVSFAPAPALPEVSRKRLFQAAEAAQVAGTGWPIGAVVTVSSESRPQPTSEGLETEIVDTATRSYDYLALRSDGQFYFVRNLEEDPEYLLADDRIDRMTELLLYCHRLYSFLGAAPATRVRITVSFSGLRGRVLGRREEDQPMRYYKLAGRAIVDGVQSETEVELGRIQPDIQRLVKGLVAPLLLLFEFYELPEKEYTGLILRRLEDWSYGRLAKDLASTAPAPVS